MKHKNRVDGATEQGSQPAESTAAPRLRSNLFLLVPLLLLGLVGTTAAALTASADGTITVCPGGPPDCDYPAIQPAIDAATAGDAVLVEPGIYTGQLTLKSRVTVASSDGPTVTVVRATEGPVVTARGALSATLQGLGISGQAVTTGAIGVDLVDSQVTFSDCVISNLWGRKGTAVTPDGESAIGIRSEGIGKLTIAGTTIQDIRGGDGLDGAEGGATGGGAVGISVSGTVAVRLTATFVQEISGGSAGTSDSDLLSCNGTGGKATGIETRGDVPLAADGCAVTRLIGGKPCSAWLPSCNRRAGAVTAVAANGGTVRLSNNLFTDLVARVAQGSEPSYAIHTSLTQGVSLERNTIASLTASYMDATRELHVTEPESPFCFPHLDTVIAIASQYDSHLAALDNSVSNLLAIDGRGEAVGISALGVADVKLFGNTVRGIAGGYAPGTATGFRLEAVDTLHVESNTLGELRGMDGPPSGGYPYAGDGGSAIGIELTAVTRAAVDNNVVWNLSGGHGTDVSSMPYLYITAAEGGDATAFFITNSTAEIRNNSLYQTIAGTGGVGSHGVLDGQDGTAVALRLVGNGEVIAADNALIKHGFGISSTLSTAPWLGHNDLWANGTDYRGVAPGDGDLHVAPSFVDAAHGDLHLEPGSALIDAGTNEGISQEDVDGEPRLTDGNNDGIAVADIGADEYWPGVRGIMTVDRRTAMGGDILTYEMVLANASSLYDLATVKLTDTLPSLTTYISGSLSGSSGAWAYGDGVVTWTGTLPARAEVTITFQVAVDEVAGPLALINEAVVDDPVGVPRLVRVVTLIDPLRYFLPRISVAP